MSAESFNKRFFMPALDTVEALDKYPQPKYFGKQVVFKLKDNFRAVMELDNRGFKDHYYGYHISVVNLKTQSRVASQFFDFTENMGLNQATKETRAHLNASSVKRFHTWDHGGDMDWYILRPKVEATVGMIEKMLDYALTFEPESELDAKQNTDNRNAGTSPGPGASGVYGYVDMSTSHVTEEDMRILQNGDPSATVSNPYLPGPFVTVTTPDVEEVSEAIDEAKSEGLSDSFCKALQYAVNHGAMFLRLDADGDIIDSPDLDFHDWSKEQLEEEDSFGPR